MPVDRELMREIRDLDEFDLRRLLIFVRGLLTAREGGRLRSRYIGKEPPEPVGGTT